MFQPLTADLVFGPFPLCTRHCLPHTDLRQFYTGLEVSTGGWIVTFIIDARGADPDRAGYAATWVFTTTS